MYLKCQISFYIWSAIYPIWRITNRFQTTNIRRWFVKLSHIMYPRWQTLFSRVICVMEQRGVRLYLLKMIRVQMRTMIPRRKCITVVCILTKWRRKGHRVRPHLHVNQDAPRFHPGLRLTQWRVRRRRRRRRQLPDIVYAEVLAPTQAPAQVESITAWMYYMTKTIKKLWRKLTAWSIRFIVANRFRRKSIISRRVFGIHASLMVQSIIFRLCL